MTSRALLGEALQTGMDAALRVWPALVGEFAHNAGIVRVYDVVPTGGPKGDPPDYLVIGDDQIIDDSAEFVPGDDVFATIHVWSRTEPPGLRRAKRLAGMVCDCLEAGFVVEGFILMQAEREAIRPLLDPGDQSGHCVVTVRLMIEPAA